MHDIWNPWHGCVKASEGCENCYCIISTECVMPTVALCIRQTISITLCNASTAEDIRFKAENLSGSAWPLTFSSMRWTNGILRLGEWWENAATLFKAGVNHPGKPICFNLHDRMGFPIEEEFMYKPQYLESCQRCGSRPICNGCSKCGKCSIRRW